MDVASHSQTNIKINSARNWLALSARSWFIVTALGQWLFVFYIVAFFGARFAGNGLSAFSGTHLANGFIPGDGIGNVALAFHILVAGLIIAAGQLQLIPGIRRRAPRLHRSSGWFYMLASLAVSFAGIYLVWSREGQISSLIQDIGTTVGGVLIFVFVPIALFYAIKRDFVSHRRWALRLFMVVSAVWFLRLMVFAWLVTTGGIGIDLETFTGPFLNVVHFAQYLLPLFILELYFRADSHQGGLFKHIVTGIIFTSSILLAVGVFATTTFFWYPVLSG